MDAEEVVGKHGGRERPRTSSVCLQKDSFSDGTAWQNQKFRWYSDDWFGFAIQVQINRCVNVKNPFVYSLIYNGKG
jgi:hypothetical protein